jgi:hypothetical protein
MLAVSKKTVLLEKFLEISFDEKYQLVNFDAN